MMEILPCDYDIHAKAIAELLNAYIQDDMGGGQPLSKDGQERLIEGLKNHPKSIVLLARIDDRFIGLVVAFENLATFAAKPMVNIHDIIVLKEYRSLGVGRALMNAVIDEAKKRGSSRVTLEVREDNVKARNLYKDLGFEAANPPMLYWRKELEQYI